MTVRLAPPFVLKEVKKDESRIKVVVKPTPAEVILRLQIDPADAAHQDDWFTLRSVDGSYEQHRKIKDDMTPGDQFVDLLFTGVDSALKYSMLVDPRPHGQKHVLFENVAYADLAVINPPPEPEKKAGEGELRLRLEIDPAEKPDDVFVLKGDGGFEQKKTVKDDQVAGDKAVDLLFTGVPRDQAFTLEVNGEALFHDVPYEELAHQSAEHAPEGHDAGTGDFKVRLEIDPADAKEAGDKFVLKGANGFEQTLTIKDDQLPGDKCVDLHFKEIPRGESLTLEIHDAAGQHTMFENVPYDELAHLSAEHAPDGHDAGTGDFKVRLEIDPSEKPNDVFVLKGGGGFEQKKTVKDDQVAGDKFVDLLFTELPRNQSFTLEVNGEPLFHDVPYEELAHLSAEHGPAGHDAGAGDFQVRLEIDPADAKEAGDKFVLTGKHGYSKTLTVKDDQVPGDKFVDLLFKEIPLSEELTLEIHDAGGQHTMFENVPYGELAHVSAEHAPAGHDAGTGDFKVRIDVDPADVKAAGDKFILRGKGGFEKVLTLKDDQVPGDKCVDLDFKELPVNESYTLEIDDGRGKHIIFEDVPYDELAHLSADGVEPEIRIDDWIDENANAPADTGS